jgi:putative acid phosphatase of HAD superfamily subfamily IIIB
VIFKPSDSHYNFGRLADPEDIARYGQVIMADDFGRVFGGPCRSLPKGPCGWIAWDLRARTPAIKQMLTVFKQARSLGVAVFFISGRDERQRFATIKNLRAAGFAGYLRKIQPTSFRA